MITDGLASPGAGEDLSVMVSSCLQVDIFVVTLLGFLGKSMMYI